MREPKTLVVDKFSKARAERGERLETCPSCNGTFNAKAMRIARRIKICRVCYKLGPTTVFANITARMTP